MGFKLKHVFKGVARVTHAVASSGMLGVRHGNFRVAGVRIGSDLVPIVQTALVVAATVAAPGVGTVAASALVTGLSGGDESDILKAVVRGTGAAAVGGVTGGCASMPAAIAIHVAGNTAVGMAMGDDFKTAIISSAASAPGISSGEALIAHVAGGALLDENPLRGGLQAIGKDVAAALVQTAMSPPVNNKNSGTDEPIEEYGNVEFEDIEYIEYITPVASESATQHTLKSTNTGDIVRKGPDMSVEYGYTNMEFKLVKPTTSYTDTLSFKTIGYQGTTSANTSSYANTSLYNTSIDVSRSGFGMVTGSGPVRASVTESSAGVSVPITDTTSVAIHLGVSDIYPNGLVVDKTISSDSSTSTQQPQLTPKDFHKENLIGINPTPLGLTSVVASKSTTDIGTCYATRYTVTESLSHTADPVAVTSVSMQRHVNIDCIELGAASLVGAAALIVAPPVGAAIISAIKPLILTVQ